MSYLLPKPNMETVKCKQCDTIFPKHLMVIYEEDYICKAHTTAVGYDKNISDELLELLLPDQDQK